VNNTCHGNPVELVVCQHVANGEPYDVLVADGPEGEVGTAVCAECNQQLADYLQTADGEQLATELLVGICWACGERLSIPRTTPDGEYLWLGAEQ
jgi:hypothetical protein